MNFLVKRKWRNFSIVIFILFVSVAFTACLQPENPDLSHIQGTECPDDKILEHIEKDFTDYLYENYKFNPEIDGPFLIKYCYGTYDGCVPVMFSGFSAPDVMRDVEIAGSVFHYGDGNSIFVWKNGEFFFIEEAYDHGWLTAEQIAIIADIHNNRNYG